jgi:uncharacterized protein
VIFIDTGYLIALFDRGDELHSRAAVWASRINEPLVTSEYVLVETVNHFSRRALRPRANDIAQAILSDPSYEFVTASPDLLSRGLEIHHQCVDKEWSLTDCISFHVMRERKIVRALAYDQHFEQAGFEAVLRHSP